MAEEKNTLSVFVTGGAESIGLATVRALLRAGHKVVTTASDAPGALAIRQTGALPVYPDLCRASELLSALKMAKADAVVHCAPQYFGGLPHSGFDFPGHADWLVSSTDAVMQAAADHGAKTVISISFAWLYDAGHGAAREGAHDAHGGEYSPMLAAEAALLDRELPGYILRAGYIYGGNSPATADLAQVIKRSRPLPAGPNLASWIHEDDLAAAIVALVEADSSPAAEILNVADDNPTTPNEFATALSAALGLNAPGFASSGLRTMLRGKTMRDTLLGRDVLIDSRAIRERFGWTPKYPNAAAGMEATAMVWRIKGAVNPDDYHNLYDDLAAKAIESFAYDIALPEPVAAPEAPEPQAEAVAEEPAPVKAAAPPPSDGPTPWNEDEAKREERRRKALERKAKRAAKSAGA